MKQTLKASARQLLNSESGQALPIMAFMLVVLLGMTGLVLDIGRLYYTHNELQAATDAAALAGAGLLPNTTATSTALTYSAVTGKLNANANMPGVTMVTGYPALKCLTTLKNQGMACVTPANANAITVRQQVTVPMYFLALLGHPSLTINATSTASMRGAARSPYNVAIIVDATASMNNTDSDSNCNDTRINCALAGVRVLMSSLSPCGSYLTTCGTVTQGNVVNPVDRVSLFTFPGIKTPADVNSESDCKGKQPRIVPYSYPSLPIYQIVDFSSDYRTSDSSNSLSTASNLVTAAGGLAGCTGLQAIGGEGTYYAGVLYAAQAELASESTPGVQNVIILLSDGDASASASALPGASTKTGVYPSTINQCQQAVTAAQAAASAGTRVYSVAYGATSSGCSTDKPAITPCQTMEQIASAPQYFYSDYTASAGNGNCVSASQPTTSLNQIFTQIAGDMSVSRLIPNNTT